MASIEALSVAEADCSMADMVDTFLQIAFVALLDPMSNCSQPEQGTDYSPLQFTIGIIACPSLKMEPVLNRETCH